MVWTQQVPQAVFILTSSRQSDGVKHEGEAPVPRCRLGHSQGVACIPRS